MSDVEILMEVCAYSEKHAQDVLLLNNYPASIIVQAYRAGYDEGYGVGTSDASWNNSDLDW